MGSGDLYPKVREARPPVSDPAHAALFTSIDLLKQQLDVMDGQLARLHEIIGDFCGEDDSDGA
jgi:hypothetical protein